MCMQWAKQNSKLGTTCCSYLGCFLQFSKDEEEELSPHMFSYREVMTQISEREEKVVEQLRELRQVWGSSKPSPGCLLYVDSSLLCLRQVLLGRQQCKVLYQWLLFPVLFWPNWLNRGIPVLLPVPFPLQIATSTCC